MTVRYDPEGKAHKTLRQLTDGPKTQGELRASTMIEMTANRRRKHYYITMALVTSGFIRQSQGIYALTEDGRDALADLNDGRPVFVGVEPRVQYLHKRSAA